MHNEKLTQWMQNPGTMGTEAVEQLPALIEAYPFCATYRLLYTIALANTHSTRFASELQTTAAFIPDRSKLFMLVNNGEYEWIRLLLEIEKSKHHTTPTDDFLLINQYLEQQHLIASDGVVSNHPVYDISALDDVSSSLLDDEGDIVHNPTNNSDDTDLLIDSFLAADSDGLLFVPKASRHDEEIQTIDPENIREKAFLTESLAKLYVKQHKFEQALAIFSTLNLKYSKKNCYFADQIRYLEKVLAYQKEGQSSDEEKKSIINQ